MEFPYRSLKIGLPLFYVYSVFSYTLDMTAILDDLGFDVSSLDDFSVEDIQFPDLAQSVNPDDKVKLKSTFHFFRSFSELKNEAKGGYIEAEIDVPDNVQTIKIALVTHHSIPEPHVNLLFVTPKVKNSKEKCLELKPEDHAVLLKRVGNNQFGIVQPRYWPSGNEEFFGPNFFKDGKLILGKTGLQLTICKAGQKSKTEIHQGYMQKYLGINKFVGDFSKARLEITFDNFSIYSKVIFDKNKYLFKIEEILTPQICNKGDQIVTLVLDNNVKITKDKYLKLVLYYDILDEEVFNDFQVISDNVVKFKINAKGHETFKDNVLVCVTVDDEAMDDSTQYDQFSHDVFIQIEEHHDNSSPKCYCERSLKKFQSSRKRKNEVPLVHPISSKPRWAAQVGSRFAQGLMPMGQIAQFEAAAVPQSLAAGSLVASGISIMTLPALRVDTEHDDDTVLVAQCATGDSPGDIGVTNGNLEAKRFRSVNRYLEEDRYRSAGPGIVWKDHLGRDRYRSAGPGLTWKDLLCGFLHRHWLDIALALVSIILFFNCDMSGRIEEIVCAVIMLGLYLILKLTKTDQNEELEVQEETFEEDSGDEDIYEEYDDDEPSWMGYGSSDKD